MWVCVFFFFPLFITKIFSERSCWIGKSIKKERNPCPYQEGRPDRRIDGNQVKFLRRGLPSRTGRFEFIADKFVLSQHRKRVVCQRKNILFYDYCLLLNKKKPYLQPVSRVSNMLICWCFYPRDIGPKLLPCTLGSKTVQKPSYRFGNTFTWKDGAGRSTTTTRAGRPI